MTGGLKLPPAAGLGVLLRNILVAREPLYGLSEWANRFDEGVLGLPPGCSQLLNDDRVGRCLDSLFLADRAAMLTDIVLHAVRVFGVDLSELHNDSTTVTFTGRYASARGMPVKGRPTHRITFGYNKDHRPDLKQLLWVLTTAGDGSVPVWCSADHGNTTDDGTHIQTWETLRRVVGTSDFLYVADSKLCTKENLQHIAHNHGRFLTVLPKTRKEGGPDDVYRGFESPIRTVEGYRVMWIWSSQKCEQDRTHSPRAHPESNRGTGISARANHITEVSPQGPAPDRERCKLQFFENSRQTAGSRRVSTSARSISTTRPPLADRAQIPSTCAGPPTALT